MKMARLVKQAYSNHNIPLCLYSYQSYIYAATARMFVTSIIENAISAPTLWSKYLNYIGMWANIVATCMNSMFSQYM